MEKEIPSLLWFECAESYRGRQTLTSLQMWRDCFFFSRLRTSWNVKETMTKMTEECLRTAVSFSSQLNLFFFFFLHCLQRLCVTLSIGTLYKKWLWVVALLKLYNWAQIALNLKTKEKGWEKYHSFSPSEQVFNLASHTRSLSLQLSLDRRLMRTI